jgi:hypothetical protein
VPRETPLLNEILVQINRVPGVRAWRNNSGVFFTREGRGVRASIPGAADITGVVTCERGCGHRLEIEVKTPGVSQSEQQRFFEEMIASRGGFYILARCVDDAINGINQARNHA